MQFLTDWISNIILLILLATILELLLPNSSMQRYVKMVVGLLLLSIILNPLFTIFSKDFTTVMTNLEFGDSYESENISFSLENKKREIQSVQLAYISEQVAVQLTRQVEEELVDQFDSEINLIDVTLEDILEEENYLESVQGITVYLQEKDETTEVATTSKTIEQVALVTIDASKTVEPSLTEKNTSNEITEFLSTKWQVPREKISVVMEGGR